MQNFCENCVCAYFFSHQTICPLMVVVLLVVNFDCKVQGHGRIFTNHSALKMEKIVQGKMCALSLIHI